MSFIFPCLYFIAFTTIQAWLFLSGSFQQISTNFKLAILAPVLFLNSILLFGGTIKPANGQILIYDFLTEHYSSNKKIYYLDDDYNFHECQAGLQMNFYQQKITLEKKS